MTEIGVRLHRVIYEHLQQFQYNCDVNEYQKCVRVLNSPLVKQLLDISHAVYNLFYW